MVNTKYNVQMNIDYSLDFEFNADALANGILLWETNGNAGAAYEYLRKYYRPESKVDEALFSTAGLKLAEKFVA